MTISSKKSFCLNHNKVTFRTSRQSSWSKIENILACWPSAGSLAPRTRKVPTRRSPGVVLPPFGDFLPHLVALSPWNRFGHFLPLLAALSLGTLLGTPLGTPLGTRGSSGGHLGVIGGHLGSPGDHWGSYGVHWGLHGGHLGVIWGHQRVIWGYLGVTCGSLGVT